MNTRSLNSNSDIKNKFDELLKFQNEKEELEHEATMLSLQFISEFNKLMGDSVTKKEIADAIGTSKSYVTQIFNGSKLLNLQTIVKIQKALNAKVKISFIADETEIGFSAKTSKQLKGTRIPSFRKNGKLSSLNRDKTPGVPLKKTSQKPEREVVLKEK